MRPRQKLRNGTWIIPGTGERTRRQFTLRSTAPDDEGDEELRSMAEQESLAEKVRAAAHNARVRAVRLVAWLNSGNGRATFKCSLAYLIASMGTFWHPAAQFLGPMDGKHIVATITVYFHPARTAGSQLEAVAIAVVAVMYSMLIGTLSMLISVLVGSVAGQVQLSYALILITFIGGGLGFVGWVKQRLNDPLVSVGASIASIGIITIITKENSVHTGVFSNNKMIQIFKILLLALLTSTAVNFLVFPVSARHALRLTMRETSLALSDMLSMISHSFLSGAEDELKSSGFANASKAYSSTLGSMNKNLRESKYEYYILGRESVYKAEKALVRSMEALAQSLGGLRSAADVQFELMKEKANGWATAELSRIFSPNLTPHRPGPSRGGSGLSGLSGLSAIDESPNEPSELDDSVLPPPRRTPSDIFDLFIDRLGPAMKSLVHTLSEILREPPYGRPGSPITVNEHFKDSVADALALFNQARARALEDVYSAIEHDRSSPEHAQANYEEVAAACGHFSFTLLSLGEEMEKYLQRLEELKLVVQENKRTWRFLHLWRYLPFVKRARSSADAEEQKPLLRPVKTLRRSQLPRGIPDNMLKRQDSYRWNAAPKASKVRRSLSQTTLAFLRFLGRDDIRFGLKVGIGATVFAMFAFIPETRPVYQQWRGEWGLLSFMIVCSMTVGASNTTGLSRFLGTLLGAFFVLVNWWISDGEPVSLALLGWLVSFFTFYITVQRGNGPMGRFILLSYNVSSLYAYSLTQQVEDPDDDEGGVHPIIRTIAFHRVVAVSMGILWGLIVCRLIFPVSARGKFKEGLCVLFLQMGLVWKRGPLAIFLRSNATASYLKTGEQAAMQRYANQLQTLRSAATNEYELRGPFPATAYGRIMASTQRLLDAFHAIAVLTQKHRHLSPGERALLHHTAAERGELCARTCHIFQVLASSIMLEYPLTDAIPSVMGIRDRLLGSIFRFRKEHSRSGPAPGPAPGPGPAAAAANPAAVTVVDEPDYALLYAFALVTGQVARELQVVEREVEALFGKMDDDALLLQ